MDREEIRKILKEIVLKYASLDPDGLIRDEEDDYALKNSIYSPAVLMILIEVEERFDIDIPDSADEAIQTFEDLYRVVSSLIK